MTADNLRGMIEDSGRHYEAVESMVAELRRLTACLHANRCHPDYTYIVVPPHATPMAVSAGWEMNIEYEAAPGDCCWRRRKP